jgi:hypothetical protein
MSSVQVSDVAGALTDLPFDKRRLNYNLGAFGESDFEALRLRFFNGMINHREFVESILSHWIQNHGSEATIEALAEALATNGDRQASGESSLKPIGRSVTMNE